MERGRSSWRSVPLWPHQSKAVEVVSSYLASGSQGSALIRMPTGTGKSGVIAVIARCFKYTSNVLVIAPWIVLRDQLADDIWSRFWARINFDPKRWPKTVKKLLPKTISSILKDTGQSDTIFVCTIQTLQIIHARQSSAYDALRRRISLVVVDEGHREPAFEWARAVRELGKPTVLFTATPYRNDHKMFNVDPKHVFAYSHHDAVREKYIREVEFVNSDFSDSNAFVEQLLTLYHGRFQKLKPSGVREHRVIVRCETSDEVNDVANRLKSKGEKVIAMHERFPEEGEDYLRKHVPVPEKTDATFWIHQFKLIEGVDDPSFALLAIYRPFHNARELVQQIGRIVRNPGRRAQQRAIVFSNLGYDQDAFWEGYRKFERDYESNPKRYDLRMLFHTYINFQPPSQGYFEGDFRDRFDSAAPDLHNQFRYRLSANIRIPRKKFSMKKLNLAVKEEWEKSDIDILRTITPDENTWVHSYVTYLNSPALLRRALLEFRIGYTFCRRVGKYIFFYDSQANSSEYLEHNTRKIAPGRLEQLFNATNNASRLTQVSLMNSDLGRQSIRRRSLSAYSIGDTAPGLADHSHFASTATGFADQGKDGQIRRYVGFTRGRITDPSFIPRDYTDFVKWVDSVALELEKKDRKVLPIFDRFARFTNPPSDPTPVNILLDIDDVMESFETVSNQTRLPLHLDDLCYDITDGSFNCVANSRKYPVTIAYDPERELYNLSCVKLETSYVRRNWSGERVRDNLIAYMNRSQSFRVVPRTPGIIYAHSRFYEPRLPLWGKVQTDRFDLLKILYSIPLLSTIGSEKGAKCPLDQSGWASGCLFHLIDNVGLDTELREELGAVEILVCDDRGRNEIADFIAVSTTKPRAIFIHAKAFAHQVKRSATSLQEVCAQAVKNLEYIHPYSSLTPPNLQSWSEQWNGGPIGSVRRRMRRGNGGPTKIWRQIRSVIRDPMSSREVWIVLGRGISRSEFESQRMATNPTPEVVQMLYLLQSTWGAVASVGATLRIYCPP